MISTELLRQQNTNNNEITIYTTQEIITIKCVLKL